MHVAPPGDSWLHTVGLDSLRRALALADAEVVGRVPMHSALLQGGSVHETAQAAAAAAVVVLEQLRPSAHRRPTESVAVALAAVTDTPVVVVPTDWVERHRGVVTVGLDPDAADDTAVRAAMTLARLRNAVLRVVVAGSADRADAEARLSGWAGTGAISLSRSRPPRLPPPLRRRRRPPTSWSSGGTAPGCRTSRGSAPWPWSFWPASAAPCS